MRRWKKTRKSFPITYKHPSGFVVKIYDNFLVEGFSVETRGTYGYTASSREYISNYAPKILWYRQTKSLKSAQKVADGYMEKYNKLRKNQKW